MKKRRTKNQKVQARHEYVYQPSVPNNKTATKVEVKQTAVSMTSLYGYEPSLLNADLWKTIWVTGIILAAEIGFYFYRFYWGG